MNQLSVVLDIGNTSEAEQSGSFAVGHDTIVGTYDTGKKAKANESMAVGVYEAFVIYKPHPDVWRG